MGPRTVVTIYPECIRPGARLPKNPVLRDALRFSANDLAHALFFTGRRGTRTQLRSSRFVRWPFGFRRALHQLGPSEDPSLRKQLQRDLKIRFEHVRTHVEPRKDHSTGDNALVLTALGKALKGNYRGRLSGDLGLAMMGLYCYQTREVVQLLETALAEEDYWVIRRILPGGKSIQRSPDAIGFDINHQAIIAEAKGRTNVTGLPKLAAQVDEQLNSIDEVGLPFFDLSDGSVFFLSCARFHRIGCIASFASDTSPMRLYVLDDRCWPHLHPVGLEDDEPLDENLRALLIFLYYQYLYAAIGDAQTTRQDSGSGVQSYRTVEIPDSGLMFGVLDPIYEMVDRTSRNNRIHLTPFRASQGRSTISWNRWNSTIRTQAIGGCSVTEHSSRPIGATSQNTKKQPNRAAALPLQQHHTCRTANNSVSGPIPRFLRR